MSKDAAEREVVYYEPSAVIHGLMQGKKPSIPVEGPQTANPSGQNKRTLALLSETKRSVTNTPSTLVA